MSLAARARHEVESLHDALVAWLRGSCDNTDDAFHEMIGRHLGSRFTLVSPSGQRRDRQDVVDGLLASHGSSPDIEIAITDFDVVLETEEAIVVYCIEWQRNAVHSTPANNARALTVVLATDERAPGGLCWIHLHETWSASEPHLEHDR